MDLRVKPTSFQKKFFLSKARYPAMVCAWATGKTMWGILGGVDLSKEYPDNLGLIVRKNFTDLRDSTIKDFTRYTGIKVPTKKDVVFPNGSQIMFRHMDELSGIIQNVNLGWFLIEQAEEFDSEEEFQKLRGRLRRDGCTHRGMVIANTNGHNWIWRLWKNNPAEEFELIEATTFDNAHNLPEEYIKDLKRIESQSPAHYRRYVMNSWEDVDTTDNIIPYEWLMRAVKKDLISHSGTKRVVACDPAEFGDDHTVIYAFENAKIIAQEITCKKEPMDTAGRSYRMSRDTSAQIIAVDASGGYGVDSRLVELGANVLRVKSQENAENEEDYKGMKAEMWFNAQRMFRDDLVSLPDDEKLIEDLAAHTYGFNSKGQKVIEKKKFVKKKLGGRSPDQGDAFVLGLWALTKVEPMEEGVEEFSETALAESYTVESAII